MSALALGFIAPAAAFAAGDIAPSTPTATVSGGVLTITGTDGPDTIVIGAGADPGSLVVVLGSTVLTFDPKTFTSITANLGDGDDRFIADNSTPPGEPLHVSGGTGNDTITGGLDPDTIFGGPGNDVISGQDGNDVLFGNTGNDTVTGDRGDDLIALGAGQDVVVWNPGDGSDDVTGGLGSDRLVFNASNLGEHIDLSPAFSHDILTRDVSDIRLDLAGLEQVQVNAAGGQDIVTVGDLRGTPLTSALVDLSAAGAPDGAVDGVIVEGTNRADTVTAATDSTGGVAVSGLHTATHVTGGEPSDQLRVNAGGGNDTVSVSPAAAVLLGISIDLGSGQR